MSWLELPRVTRLFAALALAGLTAGCFQPLYGDRATVGGTGVADKMAAVDVAPIDAPNGTRLSRVGVNVRNSLMYDMTGGGPAGSSQTTVEEVYDLSFRYGQVGTGSALSWLLFAVMMAVTAVMTRVQHRWVTHA